MPEWDSNPRSQYTEVGQGMIARCTGNGSYFTEETFVANGRLKLQAVSRAVRVASILLLAEGKGKVP
jgi:hypothetical protein